MQVDPVFGHIIEAQGLPPRRGDRDVVAMIEDHLTTGGACSYRIVNPRLRPGLRAAAEHFDALGMKVLVMAQQGGAMALHVARPGFRFSTVSTEPAKAPPADQSWRIVFRSGKPWNEAIE